jgi:ABC-type transport system involved in multi-copper enzyme maturation permease subunit
VTLKPVPVPGAEAAGVPRPPAPRTADGGLPAEPSRGANPVAAEPAPVAEVAEGGPPEAAASAGLPFRLWGRQFAAVARLELRKSFLGRRALGLYLLALAAPVVLLLRALVPRGIDNPGDLGEATQLMAVLYQGFILRIVLFLGCVAIFGGLIRREVLDRSLHFYFLTPMRRELLVVAKYLTALVVSLALFGASTLASFILVYLPHDSRLRSAFLFQGPGLAHLGSYLLVTALACAGYGAAFLALGFFFRSPAIPALALLGWEAIHFLLPPVLKQLSVIHYLQALCPVPLSEGPFGLPSDAPSTWAAIGGLLALSAVLVLLSTLRIRRMEVLYLED